MDPLPLRVTKLRPDLLCCSVEVWTFAFCLQAFTRLLAEAPRGFALGQPKH